MSPKPVPKPPPPRPVLGWPGINACPHRRFHADRAECLAAGPPEPWWAHSPDHMKGWEAFGVTGKGQPTVRRLGMVTFGKSGKGPATTDERPGTEPFGAGEVRLGVAGVHFSTHGDDPTGAYLYVLGTTEEDVLERWLAVEAALGAWLEVLWPKSRKR